MVLQRMMCAPPVNDLSVHEAVTNVFRRFGFGPFDMESVIHFAMREFDVTPFNFLTVNHTIRTYITSNFECRRGSLIGAGELSLRRVLVYYRE